MLFSTLFAGLDFAPKKCLAKMFCSTLKIKKNFVKHFTFVNTDILKIEFANALKCTYTEKPTHFTFGKHRNFHDKLFIIWLAYWTPENALHYWKYQIENIVHSCRNKRDRKEAQKQFFVLFSWIDAHQFLLVFFVTCKLLVMWWSCPWITAKNH